MRANNDAARKEEHVIRALNSPGNERCVGYYVTGGRALRVFFFFLVLGGLCLFRVRARPIFAQLREWSKVGF